MQRLERLQHIIQQAEVDIIALIPGPNVLYLTGVSFHLMERPQVIFVPATGEPVAVMPIIEVDKLREGGFTGEIIAWSDAEGYEDAFAKAAQVLSLPGKRVGVEGLQMRVFEGQLIGKHTGSRVIQADEALISLRIQKSSDEIENHRQAIRISEQALEQTLAQLRLGMTEMQIAQLLSQTQMELGGETDSFFPLVLIGPRSALPHGIPGKTPLSNNTTLLIDYGTTYNGYVSDITRTFFVGEPTDEMRTVYEAVKTANAAGQAACQPGVTAESVDQAAAQALRDAGFGDYIIHRTGHGLGLDIHEYPNIVAGNQRILEPGMVFTVEPGLYLPGKFGVRIEDNVVITEDGVESLTSFSRDLTVLSVE